MNKLVLFILFLSILEIVVGGEKNVQKQRSKKKFASNKYNKKHYNLKCWPQRCSIICPIYVQPIPQIQNTGPVVPNELLPPSNALVSTTHSPVSVSPPTKNKTNNQLIPQLINNLTNLRHDVNGKMNLLDYNNHLKPNFKGKRKGVVVKQFIQNKNSNKAIKFRQQFAPLGCYVQCESLQMGQQNPPVGMPDQVIRPGTGEQTYSTDAPNNADGENDGEEEDETDEPYHEGEDRPIEATAAPPDRSKILVYNFDDEPYDISGIDLEDKHKKNRSKGKSKHRH